MWVYSPLTQIMTVGGKVHILSKTPTSITAWLSFYWSPLGVWLIISIKSQWCTVLTTKNTTEKKNYIISHAHNTTTLQSNLFLTGLQRLLVTNKGMVGFIWCQQPPRSNANCSVNFTTGMTLTCTATKPIYSFANFK